MSSNSGGGLGHLAVGFAKALGLKVIAIDARDEGLQLAEECGADILVDARQGKEKVVDNVQKATDGQGADATVNMSDHETAAALAVAVAKRHGIMIQIAQPENVSVPFAELVFRDIKIHGSLVSTYIHTAEREIGLRVTSYRFAGRMPEDAESCFKAWNKSKYQYL